MFGIVILAVYAVLMIGVTLMFTRKTTDAEGFHVADRRIGSVIAAMSIAATWIWAPSLFTSSEMAYTRGIPGMFWFTVPSSRRRACWLRLSRSSVLSSPAIKSLRKSASRAM